MTIKMSKNIEQKLILDINNNNNLNSIVNIFKNSVSNTYKITKSFLPNYHNDLVIDSQIVLNNIQKIQHNNNIKVDNELYDNCFQIKVNSNPKFYLNSVHELNKVYKFKKFIIVTSNNSNANTLFNDLKNIGEHSKYNIDILLYRIAKVKSIAFGDVRDFTFTNKLSIMIMSLSLFQKNTCSIYRKVETLYEHNAMELIQFTKPIVIIDSLTNSQQEVIKRLNPTCTFYYTTKLLKNKTNTICENKKLKFNSKIIKLLDDIRKNTVYKINFDSGSLVKTLANKVSTIQPSKIDVLNDLHIINSDILTHISNKTNLTRRSIYEIIKNVDENFWSTLSLINKINKLIYWSCNTDPYYLLPEQIKERQDTLEKVDLYLQSPNKIIAYMVNIYQNDKKILVNVKKFINNIIDVINDELISILNKGIKYVYDNNMYTMLVNEDNITLKNSYKLPSNYPIETPLGIYYPSKIITSNNSIYFI